MKAIYFLLGLLVGLLIAGVVDAEAQVPAPPVAQQRPDIFPCSFCSVDYDLDGKLTMQDYNPTTLKAKRTRAISYRLVTMAGCNSGTIPGDLNSLNDHARQNLDGFALMRNDTQFDFTVFISCGLVHIGKCGSVNVFCLADGFPGNTNVYLSDILSGWSTGSRLSIPAHEIIGHAIGTWNEQYATCGASCGFAPTPGLRDFMNTGELSRQGFESNTLARWSRTMYVLAIHQECSTGIGWDPCLERWRAGFGSGVFLTWDPDPAPYGLWYYRDTNIILFAECNPSWSGRRIPLDGSPLASEWETQGNWVWFDLVSAWIQVPAC